MKQRTSLMNRCIALALALVLLVSQANLGLVQHAFAAENSGSTTIAQIIADNYDLSEAEKDLLKSGYLVSGSYDYDIPADKDDLVTIDTENAKITAEGKYGWVPTKAIIAYGDKTLEVALTDGVGTYDAAVVGNAFSVKVVYVLNTTVETSVQETLLGAAALLKQGVKNLDDVAAQGGNLFVLEQAMPELVNLAENGIETGTALGKVGLSDEGKAAVKYLNGQMEANGGIVDLSKMIAAYEASTKTGYLISDGNAVKAEVATFVAKTYDLKEALNTMAQAAETFMNYGATIDPQLIKQIKALAASTNDLYNALDTINQAPWAVDETAALVKTDADYAKLDTLVAALGEATAVEVKAELKVAETTLQVNMAMYNVTFKVVLNHYEKNELTEGFAAEKTETLAEGATAAELKAILESLENELLVSDVYVSGKFERSVTEIPASLSEDMTITVTYSPKNFTVTIAGEAKEYPYGYLVTLPVHEDPAKSYDYKDANGKYYPQGSEVKVEGDMTFTREEGKSYTAGNLFAIISDNYGTDKVAAILASGAVKGNQAISYREPSKAELEELVKLEDNVLTVQSYASSYAGLNWAPYSYVVDGVEKLFNGASEVTIDGEFNMVAVYYRLTLTNYAEADVRAIFDLVETLVAEAEGQKSVMDRLAGYKDQMSQLNKNMLNGLNGMIGGYAVSQGGAFSDELVASVKAIISDIINNSVASDGSLKVNGIIDGYTDPNNGGLIYYYQNAVSIKAEISYLSTKLAELLGDPQGLTLLGTLMNDMGYGEYVEKLTDLNAKMAEIDASLAPVNANIDTTNAAKLAALTTALTMDGSAEVASCSSPYIQMGPVNRIADKYVAVEVKVVVGDKTGTFTTDTVLKGEALTQAQIDALKKQIADFVNGAVEAEFYNNDYNNGSELDALVGVALDKNADYTYTWTAKEYTVKIDGEADQIVTVNNLTVNLPAHEHEQFGLSYEYTIGSKTANSGIYTFTKDELRTLFVDGVLIITRIERNANVEALEKMVSTINIDMGFEALTLVSENGNYTGIEANITAGDLMNLMMGLVMKSGYGYIGLNNEGFIYSNEQNELELSMQTLINAILNDADFSQDTFIALGENGKGKLLSATMQLGASATELAYSGLNFTLNLTSVPQELVDAAALIKLTSKYITFQSENGVMAFELNLPDKAYAVYASALVVTGNVAKNDVNDMTQKVPVQFLYDYLTSITGSEMDLETFTNTLELMGFNKDLTAYNNYYNSALGAYNKYTEVTIDDDKTTVSLKTPGQKSIDGLMTLLGISTDSLSQYLGMLKEYKAGNTIDITATGKLLNVDKTYYALVLDAQADGITNKMEAPTSYTALAKELKELAGYSYVILTADVDGDLTVGGTTVLDLNGFDVNGTITATGKLFIIDSSMSTYDAGTVNAVKGNATIIAGNYNSDVSAMLKDGYYMEGTTVRNALYTIKEENNTLTFTLNGNFYEDENVSGYFPNAKALAIDIATDLLLNYGNTAKVALGGYELVAMDIDDLVGLYASDNRVAELAKTLIGCFTIGEEGYENNAGFEGVVNMILADLLDFEAITDALNNNTALFNYELTTAPWTIEIDHNEEKDYATLDVRYNAKLEKTVNVALVIESKFNDNVAAMTEVLADIVVKDETFAMVDIPTPSYSDKTLTISGAGKASLVMDMSKTNSYATVLGVILAYGNPAKAEAVAAAINGNDMAALKVVVDNTSVKEIFTALKKMNRGTDFAAMAAEVGVNLSSNAAAVLEGKFHLVFCAAGKVLEELDITGMDSKLGALYNEETGYYELSKKDIFRDKEFNVRSYSALVELEATELTLKVKLFGDCLWGDVNHDGLVNTADASMIDEYVVNDGEMNVFFCTIRSDVNGDGKINTTDASLIREYVVGNIEVFPAENK